MKTALITGITGQDGYYLSRQLISAGYRVIGTSRFDCDLCIDNKRIRIEKLNLLDAAEILRVIEDVHPEVIFNLAARASSAQLFDDAIQTSEINGVSVVKLLEAIRRVDKTIRFCQASSCEIFSGATSYPQNENTPKCPTNAYGVAKAFADHAIAAYRASYNIFACSAILYPHESPRRNKHFLVRKVVSSAVAISKGTEKQLVLGDLGTIRDWGWAPDYMAAMLKITEYDSPMDFVLATGVALSVMNVCETAFGFVDLDWHDFVVEDISLKRGTDLVPKIGDSSKARILLKWQPTISFRNMIRALVDWELERL
jgi:GDPmannose 4,6-dehydratase